MLVEFIELLGNGQRPKVLRHMQNELYWAKQDVIFRGRWIKNSNIDYYYRVIPLKIDKMLWYSIYVIFILDDIVSVDDIIYESKGKDWYINKFEEVYVKSGKFKEKDLRILKVFGLLDKEKRIDQIQNSVHYVEIFSKNISKYIHSEIYSNKGWDNDIFLEDDKYGSKEELNGKDLSDEVTREGIDEDNEDIKGSKKEDKEREESEQQIVNLLEDFSRSLLKSVDNDIRKKEDSDNLEEVIAKDRGNTSEIIKKRRWKEQGKGILVLYKRFIGKGVGVRDLVLYQLQKDIEWNRSGMVYSLDKRQYDKAINRMKVVLWYSVYKLFILDQLAEIDDVISESLDKDWYIDKFNEVYIRNNVLSKYIGWVLKTFGPLEVDDITPGHIKEWIESSVYYAKVFSEAIEDLRMDIFPIRENTIDLDEVYKEREKLGDCLDRYYRHIGDEY